PSAGPPGDDEAAKPGFWIDGGIHANEVQSVDVVLYTAWFLCESHGRNDTIDRLLRERVFYLMPMMSPDSRDAHMTRPNTQHSPRTGQRPVDDDRDGLVDEDPPEDLDGDGSITAMYVRDPNGRLKPHPKYDGRFIEIDPEERRVPGAERYTYLGPEGYDNDGDGRVNEDGDGYYDPNRDWSWQWQPARVQRGAYRYPFSIGENRLVADFITAHPNIAGAQTYHNAGGMILRGPGSKSDTWPAEDIAVYNKLGKRGEAMLPGYRYLHTAKDLYEVWGGEFDWLFAVRGAFAFTNELNTPYNLFHNRPAPSEWFGREEERTRFDEQMLFGGGSAAAREVEHPQFGTVIVAGQRKNWGRQPASFLLEEECHRNMAFTLFHADQCPLVEIDGVDVQPLAGGHRQVTATLINRRLCPTRSRHDVNHGITPPDVVELSGATVLAALTSDRVVFDKPEIATPEAGIETVRLERLTSRRPKYVRWIVAGDGPLTITVRSIKGGTARATIESDTDADAS
ncbi:MAG: M14 family metallopeptidase, partial [Planctomycetota bacterium]